MCLVLFCFRNGWTPCFPKVTKDLEPLVNAMYRKLEPLFYVLSLQILHSSKTPVRVSIQDKLSYSESIGIWVFCYITMNQLGS